MRLMLVRGAPRTDGITSYVLDHFVRGVKSSGAELDDLDLLHCHLKQCIGCYHCWTSAPGVCVHHDDGSDILERFLLADVIVCASPLYHFSISSYLKIFLERTFPLIAPGFSVNDRGFAANILRYPDRWNKHLIVISCGAFRDMENFSAVREMFRLTAEGMSLQLGGFLLRPESYLLPFHFAKPKTIRSIETAFAQAGFEAGTSGMLSEEVQARASAPISKDFEDFAKYSTIFWEHAQALRTEKISAIQRSVLSDVRILLHEMSSNIDPATTARIKATLQFAFSDIGVTYHVTINRGTCTLEEREIAAPDLSIRCTSQTWAKLFMREINPRDAVFDGSIGLEGDRSLFTRLDRYFPPPES